MFLEISMQIHFVLSALRPPPLRTPLRLLVHISVLEESVHNAQCLVTAQLHH